MDTIGSLVTIFLVIAAIIAPQMLAVYFSTREKAKREEIILDGR